MSPLIQNIIAIIIGATIGIAVNMGIITLSNIWVSLPNDVDALDMQAIRANIGFFEPKHFIMPFAAHAIGTLVAAFIGAKLAAINKLKVAVGIGFFFLMSGMAYVMLANAPAWFMAFDLVAAYLPMGWIGGKLANAGKW